MFSLSFSQLQATMAGLSGACPQLLPGDLALLTRHDAEPPRHDPVEHLPR